MPDRNGKGPRKGSWMWEMGFRGPMAGHKRGKCKKMKRWTSPDR